MPLWQLLLQFVAFDKHSDDYLTNADKKEIKAKDTEYDIPCFMYLNYIVEDLIYFFIDRLVT